jgi:hypothetical protein
MKRLLLVIAILALYLLHQDFWYWRVSAPIVFGFLPIGLFYHVCYTLAVSALMWLLVRYAWPSYLEESLEEGEGADKSVTPSSRRPVVPSPKQEARRQ